ncbi:NAD(P)H-binding protein [Lactococcus garvieae]|uniref:NAD(P)H-binding protein n=1 Tax=Lactococcus garvieae TaxID=1363 RepID=UPI002FE47382
MTETVIEAIKETGVRRIIQAGVLEVYGEVAEPFSIWNNRMMGSSKIEGIGIEALESSNLDYT